MTEQASDKTRQALPPVQCAHCQAPLTLNAGETLADVCCPTCGSAAAGDPDQTLTVGAALRWLGKFQLIRPLGQGAFGTVYLGLDTELMRPVAVKIPRSGTFATQQDEERFVREARSVAKLRDAGVVMVHEVGHTDDFPYIVSEYVEGATLADTLTARSFDHRQSAELVAQVAMTLAHAHEQGVVHRDLKPSNIMLEPVSGSATLQAAREVESRASSSGMRSGTRSAAAAKSPPLDVRPRILDFGLARRDDADAAMTIEGQVLGTPAYMSPEQARGRGHAADGRSDIYSLGVVLFELLTGERPFRGNSRMLLNQVIQDEAPSPRKLNGSVPRDLETVCLRCLQKDPARRFQSALDLAEELRRFLRGEPIVSRPVGRVVRGIRWCRRNPVVSSLSALVLLSMLTGTIVSARFGIDARQQARRALLEKQRADVELQLNERILADSYLNLAQSEWRYENPLGAMRYLESIPVEYRGWEHDFLHRQVHHNRRDLGEHDGHVLCVAFRPDGRRIVSGGADNTLRVWDAATGSELLAIPGHGQSVQSVDYSPDGARIASAGEDKVLRIWDAESGRLLKVLSGHSQTVRSVVFCPDGVHLVSGSDDYTVRVWNARTGRAIRTLQGHTGPVNCVAVSPTGHLIASGSRDETLKIWRFESGAEVHTLRGHGDDVHCIAFRHDGRLLVSGSGDETNKSNGELALWDVDSGRCLRHIAGHAGPIYSVGWSTDDRRLVSGGADNTVRLWEPQTGKLMATLRGHSDAVHTVAFSPDGRWIVSGSKDCGLTHWDTQPGSAVWTLGAHEGAVTTAVFSPDGKTLLTGSEDGTARLWQSGSAEPTERVVRAGGGVLATAFHPDGKQFATGSADRTVRIWSAATGQQVGPTLRHEMEVLSVSFSADGKSLLTGGRDNTARVWELATGIVRVPLRGHTDDIHSVMYSPDGKQALTGSSDGTARIWDAQTGRELHILTGHDETVWCAVYNFDGSLAATAGGDGTLRLWDPRTGTQKAVLHGHSGGFASVAFSPRGNRLVSGCLDSTVRFWNIETRQQTLTLRRHTLPVLYVSYCPDGTKVLSAGMDQTAVLWDASPSAD